ncbi:helix-turn-helix domain-containing protein [Streptomyces sp. T1317-0309]|nr:helix-turn-helix domain-containing protein [Streptomyces sp. T1317-0309]
MTAPTELFVVGSGDAGQSVRCVVVMRYAQRGGLTAERRQARDRNRLHAAERLARGEKSTLHAKDLRVTKQSVERWRRAWREDGVETLASCDLPGDRKMMLARTHRQGHRLTVEADSVLGRLQHPTERSDQPLELRPVPLTDLLQILLGLAQRTPR